ncbi:Target of rapamycin complex 2 subunit ste20-like protein [Elsinoe fawcettii]|nr:Target of rapamycin complex 2 subunit ste20-like protein [Elsinoe fawcettii]
MTPTPRANGPLAGTSTFEAGSHLAPARGNKDARSLSNASFMSRGQSYATAMGPPGSFAADLRSQMSRFDGSRTDLSQYAGVDENLEDKTPEQKKAYYRDRIDKEIKIKVGSENLLEALNQKNPKQNREQRLYVEKELNETNRRIQKLKQQLDNVSKESVEQPKPKNTLGFFSSDAYRSSSRAGLSESDTAHEPEQETESPTFLLAELLQALESENMTADYYVNHANDLVSLLKRHPTLKYDLAWSIFGLRMQMLLLSDVREVIASGYRVMRHAITDRKSLQTIRELNTDYLVTVSLVKDAKASVEREQALKFVRAFLDVKDGVNEIATGIVRIIVAIADQNDDRLRPLCVMTLAEILIKNSKLLVSAGGVGVLTEAMGSGTYHAPDTIMNCFLHLLDFPARRRLMRSGFELSAPFATFTEPPPTHGFEEKLRSSSRVILSLFQSWPGLTTLTLHDYLPIRSLVSSLYITHLSVRTITLDLLFEILRIKPPSWSSTFLAGRRLTTYGRVANLRSDNKPPPVKASTDNTEQKISLIDHFTAVVLALLLKCDLIDALLHAEQDAPNLNLKRKTTLLLGEVLTLANQLLPPDWSHELQTLPSLFKSAAAFGTDERFHAVAAIYQVDSVNRTLYRTLPKGDSTTSSAIQKSNSVSSNFWQPQKAPEQPKLQLPVSMDETQFRALMIDSMVLSTVNYLKWDWDLISAMIDGPLTNPKRLDEAIKATKFVHRLLGFLRPFKYRFSDVRNTRANQRYVRAGCALIRVLLQTPEGGRYLAENKLLPQVAECLAQWDRMSGITSSAPLFSPERLVDTLACGYFPILGVLSSDPKGLALLSARKIVNMFYHLVELKDRDDLVSLILTNLDFALDSHPRIILAKALISGSRNVRILGTRLLRRYAVRPMDECTAWAIRLLVAQLYDTEIAVCEVAIKILEEASNSPTGLEYVVKCRPALDHLGEIGAPLLLRFLSSSVGYHYLDGLDYITREMDDWFLGRNDGYVTLVEASLARGLGGANNEAERPRPLPGQVEESTAEWGTVPPHFYKELTRTAEGCELLRSKGHFEEFTATIMDCGLESEDPELILKVKGCLWAVGNVGSMELGSPFLDRSNVTTKIIEIAEKSEVMTMRGTAFFVLGLISRSVHGQEILAQHGWDGTTDVVGKSLGYVLPLELGKLFSIESWAGREEKDPLLIKDREKVPKDDDRLNQGILDSVERLTNAILWNKTAAELNNFKMRKAPGFKTVKLFKKVLQVLAMHNYRLGACRFVIDLFDKDVMRKTVLQEPDSDDETSESE